MSMVNLTVTWKNEPVSWGTRGVAHTYGSLLLPLITAITHTHLHFTITHTYTYASSIRPRRKTRAAVVQ